MNSILDNPLVQKYFGCGYLCYPFHHEFSQGPMLALRILKAMEEPIKKGELYLSLDNHGNAEERRAVDDAESHYKGYWLRLPDQFQPSQSPKKECCEYHERKWRSDTSAGKVIPWCGENKSTPSAVEEKIGELTDAYRGLCDLPNGWLSFQEKCSELVSLVRNERAKK